jgi:16S rRNA (adenine1518-N6/adenine1519-N6)-dimethyltransferase
MHCLISLCEAPFRGVRIPLNIAEITGRVKRGKIGIVAHGVWRVVIHYTLHATRYPPIVNPSEIKRILAEMGQTPNKQLGQHFLIEPVVITEAINAAGIEPGDTVLEVGPGLGVLTSALLNAGARVIAIEKDRAFAERLPSALPQGHLEVIEADAAELDWANMIASCPNPNMPGAKVSSWKFISNLPYAITSLALRKALWNDCPPSIVVVLVQKEVADRCLALLRRTSLLAPRSSLLSLMTALACFSGRIIRKVPPNCFYPAPEVNSALLELVPMSNDERLKRWGIDPEDVMKIAKIGFAHPRKHLASNLVVDASVFKANTKADVEDMLVSVGAKPHARPEELSAEQWVELAKEIRK